MVRGSPAQEVLFGFLSHRLDHHVHPLKCLRAHSGARKIASACQVKFSGFRTARDRRGITSLGIAAKQRNALFQFIKMGL
jgi:hypothetical protein